MLRMEELHVGQIPNKYHAEMMLALHLQTSQLVLAMPLLGRQGMAGAPPMLLDSQTMDIVNLTQAREEKKQMKSALAAEIAWTHPAEEVPAVTGRLAEKAHLAADHLETRAEAHLVVDPLETLAAFRHRLLI